MLEIYNTSEYIPYKSSIYDKYFNDLKTAFFDIETTGLSPEKCKVILTGFAVVEGDCLRTYQFLAEDPSEEPLVLRASLEVLNELDMTVTYNGRSFDYPFFQKRCAADKVHMNKSMPYNLDIYQVIRRSSPLYGFLPNLQQKTVENFLGLWDSRKDEISGAESVELYYHYAGTRDEKIRDYILLHNSDDVKQLSKVLRVLDRCDLHSYLFSAGFPCSGMIIRPELSDTELKITGIQRDDPVNRSYFGDFNSGLRASFDETGGTVDIRIPLVTERGLTVCDMIDLPFGPEYMLLKKDGQIEYESVNELTKITAEYIQGA